MSIWIGFLLVIIGGIFQGTYFLGLKLVNPWKWENIWSLYALFALICFPWGLALITIPDARQIYAAVPGTALLLVFLFGAGWGIGGALAGLGVERMGMAMGVSVLISITAALGSFVPFVLQTPELVFAKKGLMIILAVATLLVGVALVAVGGKKRDRSQTATEKAVAKGSFAVGLVICVFSGIFSAMLNCAFAFSQPIADAALQSGASPLGALTAVWSVALAGGFIPNALYTSFLLTRNKTWSNFCLPNTRRFWLVGLVMGALWTASVILYGRGAGVMGQLGAVVGWPMFLGIMIVVSNLWGFAMGEWRTANVQARRYMYAGLAVLVIASVLLGVANQS